MDPFAGPVPRATELSDKWNPAAYFLWFMDVVICPSFCSSTDSEYLYEDSRLNVYAHQRQGAARFPGIKKRQ